MATNGTLGSVEGLDDGGDAGECLEKADPEQKLLHGTLLDGEVVKLHHSSTTELTLKTGEFVQILNNHASSGKHGHAAVLDLCLASPPA